MTGTQICQLTHVFLLVKQSTFHVPASLLPFPRRQCGHKRFSNHKHLKENWNYDRQTRAAQCPPADSQARRPTEFQTTFRPGVQGHRQLELAGSPVPSSDELSASSPLEIVRPACCRFSIPIRNSSSSRLTERRLCSACRSLAVGW